MNKFKSQLITIPIVLLSSQFSYAADEHNHGTEQPLLIAANTSMKTDHDDHEGHAHDEEKKDEHEGHAHDEEKKDEHEGHAHDEEKKDEHEGHAHDEEKKDEHDVHGHDEVKKDDDDHEGQGHEEPAMVKLTKAQLKMAGIVVDKVKVNDGVVQIMSVPGEIVNNSYNTTLLSPQINSKILSRHVVLGQHVNKGDIIAVLYSLDMATAQNQLKVSTAEWNRVKKLGKKTVGAKRFINAKAAYNTDKSLLLAYGFDNQLLKQFLSGKNSYQLGQYPITAPHNGVILKDNFQTGQYLEAGSTVALLVNEENVWVEASLAPELGQSFPIGTKAIVSIGKHAFDAKVIHDSHAIDEVTRTRKIRLTVNNKNHLLHSGLFVNVKLELPISGSVVLLPESALMRSADGDWTVFVEEEPGVFKQEEVKIDKTINGLQSIKGLHTGEKIAVKGAFFLASELAKGGFDPHNH